MKNFILSESTKSIVNLPSVAWFLCYSANPKYSRLCSIYRTNAWSIL